MKVKSKITKLCEHCFTVRKKGNSDPRHKQRQKFSFLASNLAFNPIWQFRTMWFYALQMRYRASMLGFFRPDQQ